MLRLDLVVQSYLALVQATELVDLVLVLSSDLDLVSSGGRLVFFRKLEKEKHNQHSRLASEEPCRLTIRRFMV